MTAYLAGAGPTGGRRGRNRVEESIELLRSVLDGYGYQYVSRADAARFQQAIHTMGTREPSAGCSAHPCW